MSALLKKNSTTATNHQFKENEEHKQIIDDLFLIYSTTIKIFQCKKNWVSLEK
jgi:hypothetical protein